MHIHRSVDRQSYWGILPSRNIFFQFLCLFLLLHSIILKFLSVYSVRMELSKSLTCELHIFISLSQTIRLLKLRRNVVKLSLYQHFTHTLIFSVVGELDFSVRLCQWASIWDILYIILSVLFCVLFICAASVIFMIWTTRQLKFVDCQSVSSLAYIYLAVILWETVLLEFQCFWFVRAGETCGWTMLSGGCSSPPFCWSSWCCYDPRSIVKG